MTRKPVVLERKDWAAEANRWVGRVEGKDIGTNVTILFFSSDRIGSGPPLHVHTYDEVFIVREGRARFTIGDETFDAEAGQILFGPANIPHKFENLGPGRLETTDIHLSDHFAQIEVEEET
jgi:mannose-6-phosphate isomerase-like protein (cupin superfamily)